jgi:hypothetical protein
MPKYQMIFGKDTDIPENIFQIYNSIKALYDSTKRMDHLLLFTSGRGIFKGRSFLKDKLEEIKSLHLKAHRFQDEAKQKGLLDKQILRYVLKQMFKRENFVGTLTRGGLSSKNLILSLLEWPMD